MRRNTIERFAAALHTDDAYTIWLEFGFGVLVDRDSSGQMRELAKRICSSVAIEPFLVAAKSSHLTVQLEAQVMDALPAEIVRVILVPWREQCWRLIVDEVKRRATWPHRTWCGLPAQTRTRGDRAEAGFRLRLKKSDGDLCTIQRDGFRRKRSMTIVGPLARFWVPMMRAQARRVRPASASIRQP